MTGRLTEGEILDVLHAVDRGEVLVNADDKREAESAYVNNVTLRLSNGWTFVIFNDCDEWDYIDEVTAPDGRTCTFSDIHGWDPFSPADIKPPAVPPMPLLAEYEPPKPHETWGFG